jgi:hypothetical protein
MQKGRYTLDTHLNAEGLNHDNYSAWVEEYRNNYSTQSYDLI